jgi:hypothetical protein
VNTTLPPLPCRAFAGCNELATHAINCGVIGPALCCQRCGDRLAKYGGPKPIALHWDGAHLVTAGDWQWNVSPF